MILKKQYIIPSLLIIELIVLLLYFIFGREGIRLIHYLKQEQKQLRTEISDLHTTITQLHATVDSWKTTPFYKEKIAREQLQMAYADDIIFQLPEGNDQ